MLSPKLKPDLRKMLTVLVDDSSKNININSTESELAACYFELGQNLSDKLLYYDLDIKQLPLTLEQEERLRSELTFAYIADAPYKSIFCFWKNLIVILLGVILGIAIVEGAGLKGAWIIIGAGLGASFSIWLKSYVENIKTKGLKFVIFSKSLSYKSLCRIFKLVLIAIIILLIMRDFFQLNPFLQVWLESLKIFFLQGSGLALWSNMHNVIIMLIIFSLCLKQKAELDVAEFKNRLFLASSVWWAVAMSLRSIIINTQGDKEDEEQLILNKIVRDIHQFANELPQSQQKWLIEHLNMLNIKISQPEGKLIWSDDLSLEYEAIGYLKDGDACYVDAPALWKNEKLVAKGIMRKIR